MGSHGLRAVRLSNNGVELQPKSVKLSQEDCLESDLLALLILSWTLL